MVAMGDLEYVFRDDVGTALGTAVADVWFWCHYSCLLRETAGCTHNILKLVRW